MIDGILASLVLTFLWTGWETGSVYQLGQTVTVFMGALIARFLALPIAGFLVNTEGSADADRAVGMAFLGAFAAAYGLLWIAVLNLTNEMRNFHERGPGDRFIGAACGALRGGVLGMVLIVGILTMTYDRPNDMPGEAIQTSRVGPVAMRNNFLARFADSLEADLEERASQDPNQDRAWDTPR